MTQYDFQADYSALTHSPIAAITRPIIGISGNFNAGQTTLLEGYYKSIEAAGGVPFIIPPTSSEETILALLDRIDGLLLSGGADVNPLYWNEDPKSQLGEINSERDACELLLTRLAYDRQLPIFGICRGMQVLALALGGTVHQDLHSDLPDVTLLKHSQQAPRHTATHYVEALAGTLIHRLCGERFAVNSFHHQAVNEPGEHFQITACAADGVAEAMESTEGRPILGVQWHPECFISNNDDAFLSLFRWFVRRAETYRRARTFHNSLGVITLDSHTDTPMFFHQDIRFETRDEKVLVDYHKMTEGGLDAVFMVAYLPQGPLTEEGHRIAHSRATNTLHRIHDLVAHCEGISLAFAPEDAYRNKLNGQRSIFLGIENGYALGEDLANVAYFKDLGVRYITLCHNGDNAICDAAMRSERTHGGLSDFGREVIDEMNRLGILIDLSHAGEETFYETIARSHAPVACSHSSARVLCNHGRNLTDDQLRTLAEAGGVAQVTLYQGFLRSDGKATLDDAVRHLLHMIDVAGIDHVGIGSDFDGDGGVLGCASAAELPNFTMRLLAEGLTYEDLEKIWGKNFLRVLGQVQSSVMPQ